MEAITLTTKPLSARWNEYRRQYPDVRIRNAAADLGVSEAELVAIDCGDSVTRLEGGWGALLQEFEDLGEVMALTRNDACVHEKDGYYRNVKLFDGHRMGLVLDERIDLRLFLSHWQYAFAVETPWNGSADGIRRSFQFFDREGNAIHKVFLTRKSNVSVYQRLVEKYRHSDQSAWISIEPGFTPAPDKPDSEIDMDGFLRAWNDLRDTHDFFPLLKKFEVGRTQALRLAEGRFTERVSNGSARRVLETASVTGTPIMVFVGSQGCIQIHTGPVRTIRETGPWFNVLDPDFQLHLNESKIVSAWVVRKPTVDGVVTSLEIFDGSDNLIAQFFGKRKPGLPELEEWRDMVRALARL